MDDKFLTIDEVCEWLECDLNFIERMRRGRDATRFPPPLLGEHGLSWYEQDVTNWLCFLADWRDAIKGGADHRELLDSIPAPFYLSIEPEARLCDGAASKDQK